MASGSSTASAPRARLYFGIEMEMLVRPKTVINGLLATNGWNHQVDSNSPREDLKEINRRALRIAIARTMNAQRLTAGEGEQVTDYDIWTIADERSLDEIPGFWRVELVSRILRTDDPWQDEVDQVFRALGIACDIVLTKGCAMHVHVSPSSASSQEEMFTGEELRRTLKGIAFFDEAITKIMPADRKANEWAKPNLSVDSERLPVGFKKAYLGVPSKSWSDLFALFDRVQNRRQVYITLGQDRYTSWNFSNAALPCGTIEFRRPPGVRTAADAKKWAAFALWFVAQSLQTDWNSYKASKHYPEVKQLVQFLRSGEALLGQNSRGAINLNSLQEDRSPPTVYSAAELASIKQKKAMKKDTQSLFVVKANSRPNTPTSQSSR